MKPIAFSVPVRTKNPLNSGWGSWQAQHKKRQNEKKAVLARMPRFEMPTVFVVTLTRHSRGTLDDDGLRGALKSARDAIASRLGVDDASPLLKFEYLQAPGEPAVGVRIEMVGR